MPLTSIMSLQQALRKGWPNEQDIRCKLVFRDEELITRILALLKKRRYFLIEGAEKRGKTTLARLVGFEMQEEEQWDVRLIEMSEIGDREELEYALRNISQWDRNRYLVIIEDCHLTLDSVPTASQQLINLCMTCQQASFLFTLRTYTVRQSMKGARSTHAWNYDTFDDIGLREGGLFVHLTTPIGRIQDIVTHYIQSRQLDYALMPDSEDYRYLLYSTGDNLRVLRLWLESWEPVCSTEHLRDMPREVVLDRFGRERLGNLKRNECDLLKKLSTVAQFEVPVYIKGLCSGAEYQNTLTILDDLEGKGLIFTKGDPVLITDMEARLTLEYLADDWQDYTYEYVKMYLQSEHARNYSRLVYLLGRQDGQWLLQRIISDVDLLLTLAGRFGKDGTPDAMRVVLKAVWKVNRANARAILARISDQYLLETMSHAETSQVLPLLEILRDIEPGRTAQLSRELISPEHACMWIRSGPMVLAHQLQEYFLHRMGPVREWAKELLQSVATLDLSQVVTNLSGEQNRAIHGWSILLRRGLLLEQQATRILAEQVIRYLRLNAPRGVAGALADLVEEINNVVPSEATTLIHKALSANPHELMEGCEIADIARFLWQLSVTSSASARAWVESVGFDKWKEIMSGASCADAFHLLFNIYQINREVAIKVGKDVFPSIQNSFSLEEELDAEDLPLLGLLSMLGFKTGESAQLPEAKKITEYLLSTNLRLTKMLIVVYYLHKVAPYLMSEFLQTIAKELRLSSHLALLISQYPFPWPVTVMDAILSSFMASWKSPTNRSDKMVLLLAGTLGWPEFAESKSRSWKEIERILYVQSDWTSAQNFNIASNGRRWLCWAADQDIVCSLPTKHSSLYLNEESQEVALTLERTKEVLVTLMNIRDGKDWVEDTAWNQALNAKLGQDAIYPTSELGYWKYRLLEFGVVEARYLESDNGQYTVEVSVNEDSPLTKFLLLYEPSSGLIIVSDGELRHMLSELPPVRTGQVEIRAIAREHGRRCKVAVVGNSEVIDPVYECVGSKGHIIRGVADKLRGERIDIVSWDDNPASYVAKVLKPADVISVHVDEGKKEAIAIVPDEQFGRAIGRDGENVHLAGKLTGYTISIVKESDAV